jgi:CRP-like cAMP-binding protein
VVDVLETGDFFGERCLTGNALRLAMVSALAKCVIARISKADFTRVIHEEPTFAELFISHLFARFLHRRQNNECSSICIVAFLNGSRIPPPPLRGRAFS